MAYQLAAFLSTRLSFPSPLCCFVPGLERSPTLRKLLPRFGLQLALALVAAGCAAPLAGVRSSFEQLHSSRVFQPSRYPEGNWGPAGFEFEDVWFQAADGTRLNGWYCHAEKPNAVLLVAHGESGNLCRQAPLLRALRDRHQVAVLVFDYRGYGKSDGEPDEQGILEDARAARAWLARRTNFAEHEIVLMGQSLGGAVMVELAAAGGARGLILIDTITSLADIASRKVSLVPAALSRRGGLEAIPQIGNYHGPLLEIHGQGDGIVPLARAQKLFAAAQEPKRLLIAHTDGEAFLAGEGQNALATFLASLPAAKRLPPPARWHRTGERE